MDLDAHLRSQIAAGGPLSVADYMTACLHHPTDGYYAVRPSLGADGDFVTAPIVSQMFGELLGAWIAEVWDRLGRPAAFRLVEVGPGTGVMISDALRALARAGGALDAVDLWLVEPSAPLRALQAERLAGSGAGAPNPRWADRLDGVPRGSPIILVANEVLDCLPARQWVRTGQGWAERRVGLDKAGQLAFGLAPAPPGFQPPGAPVEAVLGAVLERSAAQEAFGAALALRIVEDGGAALLIDYGRDRPGAGDTLQALSRHGKVSPLDRPGQTDLTVHADFPAVAAAARAAGAQTSAIVEQGCFLQALGIGLRAQVLAQARPDRAEVIGRQLARLIDPDQMGRLFKVLAIHQPGLELPGLERES